MTARSDSLPVGVAELRRRPGERRPWSGRAVLDGLAVTSSRVPAGQPVVIDVEIEAVVEGLVVEGSLRVPWEAECRRCLEVVHGETVVEVREVFERRPTEGETYLLGEDSVDLAPMVRDAAVLALPLTALCAPGCEGPNPQAFPTGASAEREDTTDPRWAALDALRFDTDEGEVSGTGP